MDITALKETDNLKDSRIVLNDNFSAIKAAIEAILQTEEGIKAVTDALAKVATSGKYSDLSGTPSSLPASDVYAWAKASSKPGYSWSEISGRPSSMPASDVYSWAKASSKPGYSWNEISSKPSSMPASDVYAWAKASSKPSYTYSEVGAAAASHSHSQYLTSHQDISGKANTSGMYSGLSVGYASSAGSAPASGGTSSYTEYVNNDYAGMRFHWDGQSGQPPWLWGGSDGKNMYVYNPSNFSVNYATSSGGYVPGGRIWIG